MEELLGLGAGFMVFTLALMIIMIVAWWRIFEKAGEPGWAALIPIYNTIVLLKVAKLSPWLIFVFLLAIIPVVGMIIVGVFSIIVQVKLGTAFGRGAGFILGMIFLPIIFLPILGFGDSRWIPNATCEKPCA